VRVIARSTSKAQPLRERGAEVVVGDVADPRVVSIALRDVDVVYHLAGRLFAPDVPGDAYERTHVDGTATMLACCQAQPGLRRFVHCSTTGVLGVTGARPASESAPAAPTNAYERTKWQAEELVNRAIAGGFPAVIVRPGLVYGPGDLHLLGFFRAIQRGLFRPIGRQPVWFHPVYVDDLTDAFIKCTEEPRAMGECFHVAGREPITLATFAQTIAVALGVAAPRGTIPPVVARVLAIGGDFLPAPLQHLAPLTSSRLAFLTGSRVYDVSKSQRLLGFVAATNLSAGIARTVEWYRQEGYLPVTRPKPLVEAVPTEADR
jgi:nucleoside-diphosphate-sugar epimerase